MFIADGWKDYKVLDCSDGEKLEIWGDKILVRPDPQVVWKAENPVKEWKKADARYNRSKSGGGSWQCYNRLPDMWKIHYKDLCFGLKPMGFKHTGLFPEQAVNWDWFSGLIKKETQKRQSDKNQDSNVDNQVSVLNLFAYTGGATVAAAAAGAKVCHVDAAKGMVNWAKENATLSGLQQHPIRYIVDDVVKFVRREIRRGHHYDGIIMDPPSYGRGPGGEVWKIENEIYDLIKLCEELLSDKPLFFLVNSYTTGLSGSVMENILKLTIGQKFGGKITAEEVGLPVGKGDIVLPCGYSARWQAYD